MSAFRPVIHRTARGGDWGAAADTLSRLTSDVLVPRNLYGNRHASRLEEMANQLARGLTFRAKVVSGTVFVEASYKDRPAAGVPVRCSVENEMRIERTTETGQVQCPVEEIRYRRRTAFVRPHPEPLLPSEGGGGEGGIAAARPLRSGYAPLLDLGRRVEVGPQGRGRVRVEVSGECTPVRRALRRELGRYAGLELTERTDVSTNGGPPFAVDSEIHVECGFRERKNANPPTVEVEGTVRVVVHGGPPTEVERTLGPLHGRGASIRDARRRAARLYAGETVDVLLRTLKEQRER